MTIQNKQKKISVIHIAKNSLNLSEEAYKGILSGCGLSSSTEIATEEQFNHIMASFNTLGFKSHRDVLIKMKVKIKSLWKLCSIKKDDESLNNFIKRITKVNTIDQLKEHDAKSVLGALRKMCWKAGYNPDKPLGEK